MGWLWACLGGGPGSLSCRRSKSLRGKLNSQPHDLRLQALPTQLPRYGYEEPSRLQKLPSRGRKTSEAETMEAFRIPTSSVNTCISINTLKKASEKSLESSFRREFGLSMRSDVDELKEELAALRRRLANEEAEAKKLREEVSYLRSCGVLQRSEDSSDMRIYENVPEKEASNDQANEEQRQGDIAPVKQLRKCFSGPLLFNSHSTSTSDSALDSSDSTSTGSQATTQTRISSHRAGLSPKGKSFRQTAQLGEVDRKGEEDVESNPGALKVSLSSGRHQYPSTKVAAWTSQITEESQGMSRNLLITDSMDVHWIEGASAPAPSGFSSNVRRNDHHSSSDHAESPRRPKLRALMVAEDDTSKKLIGKRRQKQRSVDFNEPIEKRSKERSPSNEPPALTPEQIEEQLSQAVAAFKQQKRELELKHQSFCHGPTTTPLPPPQQQHQQQQQQQQQQQLAVASFFRNSRKKTVRNNNRGLMMALSPVKEVLSIEEVTWSRQSSRNESIVIPECSPEREVGSAGTQGFKFAATIVEDSSPVKLPAEEEEEHETEELVDTKPSAMKNIVMVPIQCVSPLLSPKKKSATSALDALCALATASKTTAESRYQVDDSVEGDWVHDWEDDVEGMVDMKPIECASPSFSSRRKSDRSDSAKQSISFEAKESSPLLASSGEFDSYLSCGKSALSPSRLAGLVAFASPATRASPSPRKQWTPSPLTDVDAMNERSWYCDAIDAIQSINDLRRSKEGRLFTELIPLRSSKAGGGPRPPHAFSAEKKILRRAFSWYVSEHDERVRTFGLKGSRSRSQEREDANDHNPLLLSGVPPQQQQRGARKGFPGSIRVVSGTSVHTRRFSDSDSASSATFSIDFNRVDSNNSRSSSSQSNGDECDGALEGRENTDGATWLRPDKENAVALRGGHTPGKSNSNSSSSSSSNNSSLQASDQSLLSSDSSKHHLRRSQDSIPENRPVLGSMPFNSWDSKNVRTSRDKNSSDLYNNHKDTRSDWQPVTTLQRALPKVSSRGISGKIMSRSRSFV